MVKLSISQIDQNTKPRVTDKGRKKTADSCEICGAVRDLQRLAIMGGGNLLLCPDCRRLFFADEGQRGQNGNDR